MAFSVIRLLTAISLVATITWANQPTRGQVLTVCPQGPPACQFSKIQDALDAAADGVTIVILPGVYIETEGALSIPKNVNLLGYDPQSVLLRTGFFIYGNVHVSIQALTLVGSIVVGKSAQVTLANISVVGDIEVVSVAGKTEQPQARIIMVNVRISGGRHGPFSYALVVGPAEALVIGSEFLDRLIAMDGAKVWLYGTQIEVTALNHAGIEAYNGSDLVLQRVKIFSSDGHGVLVDNARLHIEESYLISTRGWGMVLAIEACDIKGYPLSKTFEGLITGRQNKISGAKELGDVCPSALEFLKSAEGGQYP